MVRPRDSIRCRPVSTPIPMIRARRVHAVGTKSGHTHGFDINYLGETGISSASFAGGGAGQAAGRNLTLDSFIGANGEHEGLAGHLRFAAA